MGGTIEEGKAGTFEVIDEVTGKPRTVEYADRVIVSYGRRKVNLNGPMCKAIYELFSNDSGFREWCSQCK